MLGRSMKEIGPFCIAAPPSFSLQICHMDPLSRTLHKLELGSILDLSLDRDKLLICQIGCWIRCDVIVMSDNRSDVDKLMLDLISHNMLDRNPLSEIGSDV